ncbi:hypothetical protein NEHOM01_0167 [Nematocida homosporus]|uniref:uncharacterized protein n=1 Tax=Nematocida homosporus TaxID=1912981 RepID=UPI0022205F89|nr:uncharacterized protein NEHOM01_0167 [Nematocida homosporus]KAI5184422.1 hypothetical protein NEHOM01_0167 [Nematocida homosporus]
MNSDNHPNFNPKQKKQSNTSPALSTAPVGADLQKDADPNASAYLSPSYNHRASCHGGCFYSQTEAITTEELDEKGNKVIRTVYKPVMTTGDKIGLAIGIVTIIIVVIVLIACSIKGKMPTRY